MDDEPDLNPDFLAMPDEDPFAQDEMTTLANNQQEIRLPWKKGKRINLGQGVTLSGKTVDQWPSRYGPFASQDPTLKSFVFRELSSSTYREESTSGSSSSMSHVSGSLEVKVDAVVASASARGEYEKRTKANTDTEKASIHSNFRHGLIVFKDLPHMSIEAWGRVPPRFSSSAKQAEFIREFGDYYVGGLVLGGDNALMLSARESSSSEESELKVKVTVKVLFVEKSFTHTERNSSSSMDSEFCVTGFDSLEEKLIAIAPPSRGWFWSQPSEPVDWSMVYNHLDKARNLETRITDAMAQHKLVDGVEVDQKICEALIDAGLVAEILLMPLSKHPTYVKARSEVQ